MTPTLSRSLLCALPAVALLAAAGCHRSEGDAARPPAPDDLALPPDPVDGAAPPSPDLAATPPPDLALPPPPDAAMAPPADNIVVADGVADTATERANSRLILVDHAGALHVVYYADGLYHTSSTDNGSSWSTPAPIDSAGRYPSLAIDGKGILHLVYVRDRLSPHDVVHRRYDGSAWGEAELVHSDPVTNVVRTSLAIDASDQLHCVWQRAGDGGATPNSEILYKRHASDSGWDADPLNLSKSAGASEYPTVVADSKGAVFVFWKDSGDRISNDKMVLLKKYSPQTGWDAAATNVSGTSGNGSSATMDPAAVVDATDQVHLVWKDAQPGNNEIFYKRYANGVWDAAPANLSHSETASNRPTVSVDAGGRVYVAWSEKSDGAFFDVVWTASGNGGWSSPQRVSRTPDVDALFPNVPAVTGAWFSVIWTEVAASVSRVRYQRIPAP